MLAALASCMMSPDDPAADERAANRDYLASVNRVISALTTDLERFSEAVSQRDVVGMNAQADSASRSIDELLRLEPPSGLVDVHTEHAKGCRELRDALDAYRALFAEIDAATEARPFDFSTYEPRVSNIQKAYEKGISHLEKADQLLTSLVDPEADAGTEAE